MPDQPADPKIAAPLLALGGWPDAPWFSRTILSDPDVVGLTFPPLAGLRRQRFGIIDRFAPPAGKPATRLAPAEPARTLPGRVAQLFDSLGALRAVACARNRLLFEGAPVLFFAELPLARIKARAAAKLRRDLIEAQLRGCVVHLDHAAATLMVWPETEATLTAFVDAAAPEHPIHAAFDAPPPAASAAPADDKRRAAREARLLQEVAALREQVTALQRAQSAMGAMEQLGLDDARLKSMLKLLHPDRHGGSQAATEAAQWLNGLRDVLRSSK